MLLTNPDKLRAYAQESYKRNIDYNRRYHKEYNLAHPGKKRSQHLKNLYGLSDDQVKAMVIAQNGVCAICGRPETVIIKGKLMPLHVDHDHVTGKVRELLCSKCNTGLGNAEENTDRLRAMIAYLEKHQLHILL
jgi:hypothetical protein